MSRKTKSKSLTRMNAGELAEATAEFDREFVSDTFGRPDAEAKKRLVRAKRKRGRPIQGRGAKAISLTMERTLLKRADTLAKKLKITRSKLVERGLRKVLEEEETPHRRSCG